MGDTVNLASRMESHGLPNKIQLSPSTYNLIKEKGFRIEKRGEIAVRGLKKKIVTHFLMANDNVGLADVLGRRVRPRITGGVEVTFINEGKHEHPPTTANSVRTPGSADSYDLIPMR